MFVFLVPKISQVMTKYEMGQPSYTTRKIYFVAQRQLLLNSVDLLCGTTVAEINNAVSLMHASGVAHIIQRQ